MLPKCFTGLAPNGRAILSSELEGFVSSPERRGTPDYIVVEELEYMFATFILNYLYEKILVTDS